MLHGEEETHIKTELDILEAIKPFLLEHGVTVIINEELIIIELVYMQRLRKKMMDGIIWGTYNKKTKTY